ncbi:MAG: hypothetical protein DKM50_01900 [Candidatus Margulisiibacteriota bacterium]|nr:MAG: hypothetical protein A2X43_13245 [Candidatus Margulisbacteria bacterium GWD2_39_127]OGI04777.1 MAG: hypothetical protein A2X42_10750 [Candidatus Margulisbacteria bacterium GWF2_38_17]OGI05722.1 MAG: hypothetical protein A2X41_03335 [Candidatus Margulisbacteria bacterium GWE2_39_32]PZM83657.1 MAG: hypothetical protein DKM50_01900 [Candidatus Margulisiibacteriota bacterium]HAR62075.1 hypothetical protein [Candidatus Margulisiibacteriota bacterium]
MTGAGNVTLIKRIGILLSLDPHGGGTYQWTLNMLNVLNDYFHDNHNVKIYVFFYRKSFPIEIYKAKYSSFCFYEISNIDASAMRWLTKVFIYMPVFVSVIRYIYPLNFALKKENIDLMIFPGAMIETVFCRSNAMFMFTDIMHVFYPRFPEVSANGNLRYRNLVFKYGIKYASQIVVETKQLKEDIIKYYNANGKKVDVLLQTMSKNIENDEDDKGDEEVIAFKKQLPEKYIFYPAQLWEHKNHKNLLFAMKLIIMKMPDLKLVLTGSRKNGDEKIFELIKGLELKNDVKYYGYVADKYMPVLYKNAQMLVMPTYFGPTNIPTVESFYYGTPAVISNIPGVTEQTGDAALLFDPDSPEDIADKIMIMLANKELRKEKIKLGYERIKLLSYENYMRKYFNILNRNLDNKRYSNAK